jgi:hypothetical protein
MMNAKKDIICEKLKTLFFQSAIDYSERCDQDGQSPKNGLFPTSNEITDLITEIWSELDAKEQFPYPQDIVDKIMTLFEELEIGAIFTRFTNKKEQKTQLDILLSKVFDQIQNPTMQYHFNVVLASVGVCTFNFELGGEEELHIKRYKDENHERQLLDGNIRASTAPRALFELTRCVEEVIGVGRVLGIFVIQRPVFMPSSPLSIQIEPWPDYMPLEAPHAVENIVRKTITNLPLDSLSEIEKHEVSKGKYDKALNRLISPMIHLFSSSHDRSKQLRHSSRLFIQAIASHDYGFALSQLFMVLEGILLADSKSDVQARLLEAVTYRIGRSSDGRESLRKELRHLYNLRSRFIHGERPIAEYNDFTRCVDIVGEVLKKEIDDFYHCGQ